MNPAMALAYDYVQSTNTLVFLTGKAGTGKTTFLEKIRQESKKNLAVVAPTGVAAINAGGMTIHSFFQLPIGPIPPSGNGRPEMHYSEQKKDLLVNLELLIIDEISMVRPDILDQIDLILRNIKGNVQPFGGVQLLLIGDLSQLSPIIPQQDWQLLDRYYQTPYFFSSLAIQKASFVRIELDHVFRQKEQDFVDLLNQVRNQTLSRESLEYLNSRHIPDFRPAADDAYITLTTHNHIAQQINSQFIEELPGQQYEFKATIRGEFPKDAYPTEIELKLKIGAQVMFVKNDSSAEKLYYNGKIGTITDITGNTVYVQCGQQDIKIAVEALEWSNIKYQMEGDSISESNAGSFSQIPLKPAWAITIHKSQGLSFDKAIIDLSEAFTHGQAYVALSRLRTLSGMVLRRPVAAHNIIADPAVVRFNQQSQAIRADEKSLIRDRELYQTYLLGELFNFQQLKTKLQNFESLLPELQTDILDVASRFNKKLKTERSCQAASYFLEKIQSAVENLHRLLPGVIGQSKLQAHKADLLIAWLIGRLQLMAYFSSNPFTSAEYLTLIKNKQGTHDHSYLKALEAIPNQKLFEQLMVWRNQAAAKENVMPAMVISEKTAASIAERMPPTLKSMSAIKGVGPQKTARYGLELIGLIRSYQQELQPSRAEQVSLF